MGKRFLVFWLPAIVFMVAIFIFSSIPSREMPAFGGWDTLVKKGGHMIGFGCLAASFWRGLNKNTRYGFLISGLLTLAFAVFDEFHQSYVPGRHASWIDVVVDSIGGGLGLILLMKSSRIRGLLLWKVV